MDDTMEVMENCRICLEQPAVLDWNEEIPDTYGTTYKYCYYKYTHLDDEVADYYPQMLCETCSNDLKSCYFLIQKALESFSILQQTYCHTNEIEFESDIDQEIEDAKEFETEVFKKPTESLTYTDDQDLMQSSFVEPVYESCEDFKNELVYNKSSSEIIEDLEDDCSNENTKLENHDDFPEDAENIIDISSPVEEEINYPQYPPKPKPVLLKSRKIMCAYCPKLIVELKMKTHEQTHKEHRERSETCPKCGLKMFNKTNLRNHMKIHDEKREKRYKCEFCEKAYFNRGALNVHRRIHLGQLIPCPICPKKFYRQVDLEKHKTTTHSANIEDTNYKFTKYYVECKDCGKNILTQQWKHHALMHLNKMQMKCTLCDKHFASKITCHKHVRKTHKYKGSFAKVVEYYGAEFNIKHSHLMLKQFEIIKPVSTNNDNC